MGALGHHVPGGGIWPPKAVNNDHGMMKITKIVEDDTTKLPVPGASSPDALYGVSLSAIIRRRPTAHALRPAKT